MSYLRTNGRLTGRVSGRWGSASIDGQYQLGDTLPAASDALQSVLGVAAVIGVVMLIKKRKR